MPKVMNSQPPYAHDWGERGQPGNGALATGDVFSDGSVHGRFWGAARGGWGVAVVDEEGQISWSLGGTCPEWHPTSLRAELRGVWEALRRAAPPIRLHVDCQAVLDGISAGKEHCTSAKREGADLWRKIWPLIDSIGLGADGLSFFKVKAHCTRADVEAGLITPLQWAGNAEADRAAKRGCNLARQLRPNAVAHAAFSRAILWYRWLAILTTQWPSDVEHEDEDEREAAGSTEGHGSGRRRQGFIPHLTWRLCTGTLVCRRCGREAPKDSETKLRMMRTSRCLGSAAGRLARQQIQGGEGLASIHCLHSVTTLLMKGATPIDEDFGRLSDIEESSDGDEVKTSFHISTERDQGACAEPFGQLTQGARRTAAEPNESNQEEERAQPAGGRSNTKLSEVNARAEKVNEQGCKRQRDEDTIEETDPAPAEDDLRVKRRISVESKGPPSSREEPVRGDPQAGPQMPGSSTDPPSRLCQIRVRKRSVSPRSQSEGASRRHATAEPGEEPRDWVMQDASTRQEQEADLKAARKKHRALVVAPVAGLQQRELRVVLRQPHRATHAEEQTSRGRKRAMAGMVCSGPPGARQRDIGAAADGDGVATAAMTAAMRADAPSAKERDADAHKAEQEALETTGGQPASDTDSTVWAEAASVQQAAESHRSVEGHHLRLTGPIAWCVRCGRHALKRVGTGLSNSCSGRADGVYASRKKAAA